MVRFLSILLMLSLAWVIPSSPAMAAIPEAKSAVDSSQPFLRLAKPTLENTEELGPLKDLPGTWVGDGWNLIAVPAKNKLGEETFNLEIRPYTERITFTPVGAKVPNKGFPKNTFVQGVHYQQEVSDKETNEPMHVENGFWLLLEEKAANGKASIARLSSVPHGNSILALGNGEDQAGQPQIDKIINARPIHSFKPGYDEPSYTQPALPIHKKLIENANQILKDRLSEQKKSGQAVKSTTTLDVSTEKKATIQDPLTNKSKSVSGGIINIPFIRENADATSLDSTFWIETVANKSNSNFLQLQYSQQTNLDFLKDSDGQKLIVWPHVDVSTLVKQ